MNTLNHNITQTHSFQPLRVEGQIPSELRGTLYRAGPGLVERFGHNIHPFMADGAITAIQFDQVPKGACNLIKTEKFLKEERAHKSLFNLNAPFYRRLYNGLTRTVKNTGNTNILSWNHKLYALMEQGKPVEFSTDDLATVGIDNLGLIKGSFSAHPHRVDSLKTTFNFGINGKFIEVFALSDNGRINMISRFQPPWVGMVHDFIVTEKHIVFFIDPAKLVYWRAALGLKDFRKYFYWDDRESTHIVIIPLSDPERQIRLEVDAFRVWHFANAFEQRDAIVIDAFRHKNIDVLTKPTTLDSDIAEPELYRFSVSLKTKQFQAKKIVHSVAEFPIVNPYFIGRNNRYIWSQTYADKLGNEGFSKFDTETHEQQRWFAPDNHLVSEAIFVPAGMKEDDGWILQLIQDCELRKSYLAVFESKNIGHDPVAKLWFEHPIPATFHGIFVGA